MGRERDGVGGTKRRRGEPENTGSDPEGEGRHGQQHTSARKLRKRAQGQGAEHHRCQVPSVLQQQGKRWAIREGGDGVRG